MSLAVHGIGALALLLLVASRPMHGPQPSEWPIERIIENLEAKVAASPDDAPAHYNLGRAHAFAFALERPTLWALGLDDEMFLWEHEEHAELDARAETRLGLPPPTPSQLLEHLSAAVRHLRRACELEQEPEWMGTIEKAHLTFAWLLETGAHLADRVDTPALFGLGSDPNQGDARVRERISDLGSDDDAVAGAARSALERLETLTSAVPALSREVCSSNARRQAAVTELLERFWIEKAIEEYWRAFDGAIREDLRRGDITLWRGDDLEELAAFEALAAYRRLVAQRGLRPEDEKRLAEAEEKWKRLEALPRGFAITPLLTSLEGCAALDALVLPDVAVPFDLDGDGTIERWPWIQPHAGWLVWDPGRSGEITWGRQLFGSASAWLFFPDGYRVLDALDDDRDRRLDGAELAGIAAWFDRDTDGVSDRGEVVPVEELGIVAIATEATERIGESLGNPCGLELADGRVLPTYDWVLSPVTE